MAATPTRERLDIRVHPEVRARVLAAALEGNLTANELVNAVLCARFGLDPLKYKVSRKRPGRPSKCDAGKLLIDVLDNEEV